MKRKNGTGSVYKLSGNRRNPYAARITTGYVINEETQKSKPVYEFIGFFPTYDDALASLLEYNRNPYELNSPTFKEVYGKWIVMKEEQNLSENTISKYNLAFGYLEPLHNTHIKDFTLPFLQSYFDNLAASKGVLNLIETTLKQCIEYSIKRGLLPIGSGDLMKMVDTQARKQTNSIERKSFTKEERQLLWKHSNNDHIKVILFYIYTGLRFGEYENLTDDCWHDNYVEIRSAKTVSGIREVPLSDCVKELFPIPKVENYNKFRYHFTEALREIGIVDHRIHDTRHTFISMMTEVGTDARILKQIIGHRDPDVTEKVYTHISIEKKLEVVNRINKY